MAGLLAAPSQGQTPPSATTLSACSRALAGGTSAAAAELCLAEEPMRQAAAAKASGDQMRRWSEAAEHYRRAATVATDPQHKVAAFDALANLYAPNRLNQYDQLEAALRELIDLEPEDLEPVFRLAKAQEDRGVIEAAEETLLAVRRQHPDQIDPFKMLAQFYARRATAIHTAATTEARQPTSAPGEPDEHGVYRIGGGLTAPSRLDQPVYPPDAQAAGIKGVVIAEVVIDPAGDVIDAKVVRSIPMLDDAALAAVRNWRFTPTMVKGQAVPVRMTVTVNFTLK